MMTLGSRMRMFRSLKKLTQENMSERLDISTNAYGKMERDQTNPSYKRLEELASIFEISILELMDFDNKQSTSSLELDKIQQKVDTLESELSHFKELVKVLKIN
mgnify:CR=1 FL=1